MERFYGFDLGDAESAVSRLEKGSTEAPEQLDMFTDYGELERRRREEETADSREKSLQKTALKLQERFGKNAVLKAMNLEEGATTVIRNGQVGGHRAE